MNFWIRPSLQTRAHEPYLLYRAHDLKRAVVDSDPYGHNFKDKHSETISMRSGVPQGSVICPLLLFLFVIDLPDGLEASKWLLRGQ